MVFYEGVKYACEACIKGHRSSSCTHTTRPLFEIKKKGRPVTQCSHCRQLRKTKQVHVKCSCEASAADPDTNPRKGARRKLPASASFPHGLDSFAPSTSASPSPAPQVKAEPLCACGATGACFCATPVPRRRAPSSPGTSPGPATPPPAPADPYAPPAPAPPFALAPRLFDYAPAPAPHPPASYVSSPALYAPPAWLGLDTCQCGAACTCPGCVEHADPATALASPETCPYACATCASCAGLGFAPAAYAAPAPASPPAVASGCCGGACACAACACAPGCCGCCAGCACADPDPDSEDACADPLGCGGPRVGFAVSGERGRCGECVPAGARAPKRRRLEHAPAQGPSLAHAQTQALFSFSPPPVGSRAERWSIPPEFQ